MCMPEVVKQRLTRVCCHGSSHGWVIGTYIASSPTITLSLEQAQAMWGAPLWRGPHPFEGEEHGLMKYNGRLHVYRTEINLARGLGGEGDRDTHRRILWPLRIRVKAGRAIAA